MRKRTLLRADVGIHAVVAACFVVFENGAEKVWVDPNPDNVKALALYERLGFVRRKMPDYLMDGEEITSVYMELCK